MPGILGEAFTSTNTQNNTQTPNPSDDFTRDLAQSRYDFSYRVFPDNVGMDDIGHYMIININVPVSSGQNRTNLTGLENEVTVLGNELSKVDTLRLRDGLISPGQIGPTNFALERETRRIAESIALYMPTPLVYNGQNMYQEVSLTALGGEALMGAAGYAGGFLSTLARSATQAMESVIGGQSRPISDATGSTIGTVARLGGYPINPAVEILFANTPQRQFVFEFLLAPRNEKESLSLQAIIKTLRFHAAPELSAPGSVPLFGNVAGGFYWIPPAEFDITFMNKGQENTNILRINTCVLERCEVDYAPSGVYSTFRNGHPVAVRLSLGFREIEPIHKKRVRQGF
jgi:hypothetical protein